MAQEKYTVFFNIRDGGNQAPAVWTEKEVITPKATEKNIGNAPSKLNTAEVVNSCEVQQCYFVSITAESATEAAEAVATFYSRGITNPAKSTTAPVVQGVGGGGWVNNKVFAVNTNAQTATTKEEVVAYP